MPSHSILAERLKTDTHESHVALERLMIPKIKGVRTTRDYETLLKVFYGYYKPLEDAIAKQALSEHLPDHYQRRKAELITEDLSTIGANNTDFTLCEETPSIESSADALGVMYVLEGSTLGGKIISQMIVKNLQLESLKGVSFFSGYGEETMKRWSFFKDKLNSFTTDKEEENKVITAARQAFEKFKKWIELNYQVNGN